MELLTGIEEDEIYKKADLAVGEQKKVEMIRIGPMKSFQLKR